MKAKTSNNNGIKQKQSQNQILISCPHNKEHYILVPKEYAESVLENGRIV